MSIADEITRLQTAKANIKSAINNKGGSLENETLDQYASKVTALPSPKAEETKTITSPDFSSGNIVVTPTTDKVMTKVTINKDTTNHIPENIKDGITLYGVAGTYEGGGGGGGLTGGYNVVYRSDFHAQVPSWISITLTFVDDTTSSYVITTTSNGNLPSDWEHYTGGDNNGDMIYANAGPYVWNNVKSVSITAQSNNDTPGGPPNFDPPSYLEINGENVGKTYNETLDRNILVSNGGGKFY